MATNLPAQNAEQPAPPPLAVQAPSSAAHSHPLHNVPNGVANQQPPAIPDSNSSSAMAGNAAASAQNALVPSTNGAVAGPANNGVVAPPTPALPEARLPTRKDTSLKEFLNRMDDYAPIIPDAVTNYYMTRAGLPPPPQTDQRLARLLALATQKFIADIAADAYQYSRIRASNTSANNPMGSLGAAAGFPIPGQQANQPGGKDQASKGGPLGIQRPGYGGGGQGGSQNRTVLTMEDLGMAVGEFGVNVKRSEFYR
ncbi:transcription initiation factor TFIID subunit 10 [Rhypophila sp. PSN 637]